MGRQIQHKMSTPALWTYVSLTGKVDSCPPAVIYTDYLTGKVNKRVYSPTFYHGVRLRPFHSSLPRDIFPNKKPSKHSVARNSTTSERILPEIILNDIDGFAGCFIYGPDDVRQSFEVAARF